MNTNNLHRSRRNLFVASGASLLLLSGGLVTPVEGQAVIRRGRVMMAAPFGGRAQALTQSYSDEPFAGAATLETDPEVDRLLRRAEQYVADERYDLAVVLAQKVLDGPSSLLVHRREEGFQWYSSTRAAVEQMLAKLPPEALAGYRLTADAEVRGLMAAEGEKREAALAEAVRRFFISSLGDDAAFELGCRLLDAQDFVSASRMFDRVLSDHPDPSIPRDQLLLRQAVANARLGDMKQARDALAELNKLPSTPALRSHLALVRQHVDQVNAAASLATSARDSWPMQLGTPARDGVMPSPPKDALAGQLVADTTWQSKMFPMPRQQQIVANGQQTPNMSNRAVPVAAVQREDLVKRWKAGKWIPATQAVLHDGRIYMKSYSIPDSAGGNSEEFVSSFSTESGELAFETRPAPAQANIVARVLMQYGVHANVSSERPVRFEEIMLFGDRTNHMLSVIDGVLYVVEGSPGSSESDQQALMRQGIQVAGSSRNRLSAFWDPSHPTEPSEGKVKWTDEGNEWMANVRFASAPLPVGDHIAVVGREGSGLYLYAVSPANGSLVWKTFLCDEPRTGVAPWAPVGMAVDGDEVYIASGCGVVFTIDGISGGVRWAVQYERPRNSSFVPAAFPVRQIIGLTLKGWDEDTVIPRGLALLVMPSDSDQVYAFDRRTGKFLWKSPKDTPDGGAARYCLGVAGDSLYVAGNDVVRRIKVTGGSIVWEQKLETSLGRGILTENAIYLPVNESILQLDLNGKKVAQVGVTLPDHDDVGNLLCDGRRFYVVGMDRLHALRPGKSARDGQDEPPKEEAQEAAEPTDSEAN